VAHVREITGKGADFALEASGRPEISAGRSTASASLNLRIVGAIKVAFKVNDVMISGRRIMGNRTG